MCGTRKTSLILMDLRREKSKPLMSFILRAETCHAMWVRKEIIMEVNHAWDSERMEQNCSYKNDNEAKGTCHSCYVCTQKNVVILMMRCHDNVSLVVFSLSYIFEKWHFFTLCTVFGFCFSWKYIAWWWWEQSEWRERKTWHKLQMGVRLSLLTRRMIREREIKMSSTV